MALAPHVIWRRTILGEPASKANSRRFADVRGRRVSIKSEKALGYAADFAKQCPRLRVLLQGRLRMTAVIYYRTERPDLDESLILDLLQGRVYANDRQVRERHVYHRVDAKNPRVELELEELSSV